MPDNTEFLDILQAELIRLIRPTVQLMIDKLDAEYKAQLSSTDVDQYCKNLIAKIGSRIMFNDIPNIDDILINSKKTK